MFIEAKHYSPKHEHSIVESKFSNKQKPKLIPNFESFQELNFEKTFVGANQERVVSSFLFANDSAVHFVREREREYVLMKGPCPTEALLFRIQ